MIPFKPIPFDEIMLDWFGALALAVALAVTLSLVVLWIWICWRRK